MPSQMNPLLSDDLDCARVYMTSALFDRFISLQLGYPVERLKSSFRKFYGRYGDLIQQYEVSL